jgi:hypothetical protein
MKERETMFPHYQAPDDVPDEPSAVELDDIELIAGDPVLQWRAKRLAENGMIAPQARALALDRTVDVTWVIDRLIKRGCEPDTAFDIASGVMAA